MYIIHVSEGILASSDMTIETQFDNFTLCSPDLNSDLNWLSKLLFLNQSFFTSFSISTGMLSAFRPLMSPVL